MPPRSIPALRQQFTVFAKDVGDAGSKAITLEQAKAAQKIATRSASADLGGDPKFSGWAPTLDTQIKEIRDGHLLTPTRSSAGPWTVAEKGRNQGNARGFAGPGVNARTGRTARTLAGDVRKVRARKARRWNGVTAGKRTASQATSAMQRELPKIAETGMRKLTVKHFG